MKGGIVLWWYKNNTSTKPLERGRIKVYIFLKKKALVTITPSYALQFAKNISLRQASERIFLSSYKKMPLKINVTMPRKIIRLTSCPSYYHYPSCDDMWLLVSIWQPAE